MYKSLKEQRFALKEEPITIMCLSITELIPIVMLIQPQLNWNAKSENRYVGQRKNMNLDFAMLELHAL
jgi:hypothetical protein